MITTTIGQRAGTNPARAFRAALRSLEREVELALLAQTECCGVSLAQCHLLLELEARGPGSIGDFAAALELDASTLSRTSDGLVRAGLASREEDPANRRRQILGLSPAGAAKVGAINELCDAWYGSILDGIPERRRRAAVESLGLLADSLRAARARGGGCCAVPAPREE